MSWFRTLFRLFDDNEKAIAIMQTNYDIPGVVFPYEPSMTPEGWLGRITSDSAGYASVHRLTDLEGCNIDSVAHYREKNALHERIIIRLVSQNDTRYIRLERYRFRNNEDALPRKVSRRTAELSGSGTGNSDMVNFYARLAVATKDGRYELVQEFTPSKPLRVIDVAALASTITHIARDFSLFCHMCHWWSALFFATARRMAGDPPIHQGPAFDKRGRGFGVRFVDDEGRLFGSNGLDINPMITLVTNNMKKAGVDADEIQRFGEALKHDFDGRMTDDERAGFKNKPVDRAYQATLILSKTARADIEKLVRAAEERRDELQVAHARAQMEADGRVAAEGRAQMEADRAQAEADGRVAAEGRAQMEADRAQAEADGRVAAEARAQAEMERRLELEAKLSALEL